MRFIIILKNTTFQFTKMLFTINLDLKYYIYILLVMSWYEYTTSVEGRDKLRKWENDTKWRLTQ